MVEMFYHRLPSQHSLFITLSTESGRSLSLTPRHLVPLMDCEVIDDLLYETDGVEQILRGAVFAEKVRIRLCIYLWRK